MSESTKNADETDTNIDSEDKTNSPDELDVEILDDSVDNAIALYRKVREGKNKELTEKQIADIDKECEIIRNRKVITKDLQHTPAEITNLSLIHI